MLSLLVFSILFVTPLICKGFHKSMCNVVPKNPFIERGSSAKIMCDTSCLPSNVYWTLDKKLLNDTSMSKRINSTHTILTLSQFTNHNATLQCHREFSNEVLGGAIMKIYTKPRISSCVFHYENQDQTGSPDLFTCKWEDETDSSLKRKYTLFCDSCPPPRELCTSQVTNCTASSDNVLVVGSQSVTVRAEYASGNVSSDPYEFEFKKICQITKPKIVNLTALSDRLLVNWRISTYVQSDEYHCQVRYRKAINDGTSERVLNRTQSKQTGEITIQGVDSCSNYTLAVRCAIKDAPWSSWSQEQTILTKLNRNVYKPWLWRKVRESGKGQVRKVRTTWTRAPSTCQETLSYTIKQTPYEKRGSHKDTSCENSTCEMNQDAHRIHLTVLRDETVFAEESVYVPAIGENLPQVTNIQTTTLNGDILVSWEAPVQPVSGYMVDYTYDGDQYKCEETNHTNVTLSDLKDRTPYDITVTPLFGDKTGHGAQALHICSRVGESGHVEIISIQSEDKRALVRWTVKPQQLCSGVVVNYTVVYYSQNHTHLNLTVDGKKQEILLEDLKPETHYSVYVVAWTLTGSNKSDDMSFKTKRFDPRLSTVLSICGSILVILVLAVGLYCAVQWKKYKQKPVPDPYHSSLAKWASENYEKGSCPIQPFHYPSESIYDQVYTEETKSDAISPLETGEEENLNSDKTGEYAGPAMTPVLEEHEGHQVQSYEIHQIPSSEETMELLSYEQCPSSPYRTQSPVETPALKTGKQFKHVPVKKQEEMPPVTVYVTLDMFEQGQGR